MPPAYLPRERAGNHNTPSSSWHTWSWKSGLGLGDSGVTTQRRLVQTRTQRLRRVLLLACHFARNLGYYRSGMRRGKSRLPDEYWKTVTSNCLDVCILEWCKMFADPSDPHHWRNIVSSPSKFEEALYKRLRVSAPRFEAYRIATRRYRDKFLAHLDSDLVMEIPTLDLALSAACLYYAQVHELECSPQTARSFPRDLFDYYAESNMSSARVLQTYIEGKDLQSSK
jgi:hypothetical protein